MQTGNEAGLVGVSEASGTVAHRALPSSRASFLEGCVTILSLASFYTSVYQSAAHLGVDDVLVVLGRVKDFSGVLLTLFI